MPLAFLHSRICKYAFVILVISTMISSAYGCNNVSAQQGIENLNGYINSKQIGNIEVFARPYNVLTPIPMSSESLEKKWKIDFYLKNKTDFLRSMLNVLSNLKLCKTQEVPDFYFGLVVYNKNNQRIFSLHLEREYILVPRIRGQLNGVAVVAPASLLHRFESVFTIE